MREKVSAWLGVAMLVILPFLADICGLDLPKWLRFGLLHGFFVAVVVMITAWLTSHIPEVWRPNKLSARRSTMFVIVFGALIGAIIAPMVWNSIRPDDIDIAKAVNGNDDSKATGSDPGGVAPSELELYFHPFLIAGGQKNIQYSGATLTNRSSRKMHLELWAHIYYWKDSGEPTALGFQPKWNPQGIDEKTGQTTIDLDAFETEEGVLILFLEKPEKSGVRRWNVNPYSKVFIHAFDSVTGKHVAFKASPGYPDAKMPWPLPSPAELLALDFPQTDASASHELPPLESLELLARTQFFGYRNDKSLSISAVLTNLSSDRMKIQVNLLTRNSVDDKEWRTFRGVIEPSRKENKNHLDYYALDFGPGDVAECSLVFANTGFTNKAGEELDESPRVTLLEIFDEVSRKKVWCAIEPGYPPRTDMRSATILPPPAIPQPNSDN